MVKRKGSTSQAPAQTCSKRLKEESNRTKATRGRPAKCAKAAKQLPPDDDSQDFEPEKPLSKPKVRRTGAASPAVCPTPRDNSTRGKKPSKARGSERCPSVKKEGGKETKCSAAAAGSLIDQMKKEKESSSQEDDSTEDSEDDWEEVEELHYVVPEGPSASPFPETTLPAKTLEIEIESPAHAKKLERREKKQVEFEDYLRRMINRFTRNLRMDIHKVHLLCLLANGLFRNRTCNEPELWAMALSLVPTEIAKVPGGRVKIPYISKLLKWFVSAFEIDPSLPSDEKDSLLTVLKRRFSSRSARNEQEMVHLLLITLRALPLESRLVISLQPVPFKESLKAKNPRGSKSKDSSRQTHNSAPDTKHESVSEKGAKGVAVIKQEGEQDGSVKTLTKGEDKPQQAAKMSQAKHVNRRGNTRGRKSVKNVDGASAESGFEDEQCPMSKKPETPRPKNDRQRRVASKVSYKEEDTEGDDDSDSDFEVVGGSDTSSDSDEDNPSSEGSKRVPSRTKTPQGRQTVQAKSKNTILRTPKHEEDSEEDFFESNPGKINLGKRRSSKCNKARSRDEKVGLMSEVSLNSKASDQWIEVYAEAEKKWVAVDCVRNILNQPELCAKHASKPLSYIISFDNESCVRDVTQRYDLAWMTVTRKHRVDPEWWDKTLAAYKSNCTERQKEEDLELQAKLLERPLPTSVGEYKNHPLYVLKRHLLKYEILYPPTAAILGYCKTEAVYSRDCVQTLHSKDLWLKEARVVKDGEIPSKMVKSQSNRARRARSVNWEDRDKDDLGLFGHWQTEPYSPPSAVNGKVPRNDFGNVYLFKPCMLPVGCKCLRVPNINKVARKLNIDCAAAVTGFDFHKGHSHPIVDGYVVCEEYVETLLAACEEEEAEMAKKEQQKREQRVMGNWKLLVKGLLIRERLKARFNTKDVATLNSSQEVGVGCSSEEGGHTDSAQASDLTSSWPLNRQEVRTKSKRQRRGEEKHLFPFEKL
ncbi:DNA repair protein complementing XP-C cells isoform X1 [Carcharodon carcharias]|uniref:DNA repair protein complementing XP-C cells isoform X1 n=2 Tax=Carcharodon carcharias TaxID=13397 RepID=UPI001B7F387E|nr:DNA repair protein complementing XP-C cells isoform X1 [Carcharodon carcharias]